MLKRVRHARSIYESEAPVRIPTFDERLEKAGLGPLRAVGIKTLQVNLGYVCNMACIHCHLYAGPGRKEAMGRGVMEACLEALNNSPLDTLDITGGAPEINPSFRWLVDKAARSARRVMVRTNLTALLAGDNRDIPLLLANKRAVVIGSLPCYLPENVDAMRGDGAFARSIEAIRNLNLLGYGMEGTGLLLYLVYNPASAELPPGQAGLEADYRRALRVGYNVSFTGLYTMTNVPLGRFRDTLASGGAFDAYMRLLEGSFNDEATGRVMCRETISVGPDGTLYDCDFNQAAGIGLLNGGHKATIMGFDYDALSKRRIATNSHCYACTAGAGSSCTGATVTAVAHGAST